MIVTYLRSSSYSAYDLCPQNYFLAYVLGLPAPAGPAAAKGNVVHKALETLAWQSKCRREGVATYEDETFGVLEVESITPEWAVDAAYRHYREVESHVRWNDRYDLPECRSLTRRAITAWGGRFDPRNLDIVMPEQRFDIVLPYDWARFAYETPDGPVVGQLGLKGTMDIVARCPGHPDDLQLIDWKTGRRWDWAKEKEKDFEALMEDLQLLLYHYACRKLFPAARYVHPTIVYIKDTELPDGTVLTGGPYQVPLGPEHVPALEAKIRERFEEIRDVRVPRLKKGRACFTFCPFGTKTRSTQDPTRSICDYFADQVRRKGADAVTFEFGRPAAYLTYGDGGGRKASDD